MRNFEGLCIGFDQIRIDAEKGEASEMFRTASIAGLMAVILPVVSSSAAELNRVRAKVLRIKHKLLLSGHKSNKDSCL